MKEMGKSKLIGMKIGFIGLLIVILGTIFVYFQIEPIGKICMYIGFIMAFLGVGLHAVLFLDHYIKSKEEKQ